LLASTNISEYEGLISNNINAVKLFYRDVSSIYNDLNHIWSMIMVLRKIWENQIVYERDVELYRISRSCEPITDMVKDEVKRLNNESERETKKLVRNIDISTTS